MNDTTDTRALIQNTPEWYQARVGSLGASQIADAVARTKTGWGASRANVMAQLLVERLTGTQTESYMSPAMQWGMDYEGEARTAYEFHTDASVTTVGLVKHPAIAGTHASPDGCIGDVGLLEIKCPYSSTHIETLLDSKIPDKYIKQMMWQIACSGAQWCDFVSYDPRMPESMRLFIKRVPRDDALIAELETAVREFLAELETKLGKLQSRYEPKPKVHRHWSELSLPEQCGIRCADADFQRFVGKVYDVQMIEEIGVVDWVRNHCQVKSRAELGTDDAAAERWVSLNREYENWRHNP